MLRLLLCLLGLCGAKDLQKSIGLVASTDSGLQLWANSSAVSTASLIGNAVFLLGGLYLLSRSDEVLALTDQLLPRPAGPALLAPVRELLPGPGLPQFGPVLPQGGPGLDALGRVQAITRQQVENMQALTKQQVHKVKELTRKKVVAMKAMAHSAKDQAGHLSLSSLTGPHFLSSIRQVAKMGATVRQNMLSLLRPVEVREGQQAVAEEPHHRDLPLELPFLGLPAAKAKEGSEEEVMAAQLVPPPEEEEEAAEEKVSYATKRFEDRFRKEDEELQAIIEAHLSNFESFKIPKEEQMQDVEEYEYEDSDTLGSDVRATTVEIVFGAANPTMTSLEVVEENEADVTTTQPTLIPESGKVEEKTGGAEDLELLKQIAREFLRRKYKRVKKPKKLDRMT